jgi:hypothetical protein
LAEGLAAPVEEDLRLALFIAGDVVSAPLDEFKESFPAQHGGFLKEKAENGKRKAKVSWRPTIMKN